MLYHISIHSDVWEVMLILIDHAEFSCHICRKLMAFPLTTPCAHNFCKACLEGAFSGKSFMRQRTCEGRRMLRAQKNIMKCPSCSTDIADFLQNPQVCLVDHTHLDFDIHIMPGHDLCWTVLVKMFQHHTSLQYDRRLMDLLISWLRQM